MKSSIFVAALTLLGLVLSSCSAEYTVISLHQNIHHDDFEYSVQSVDKAEQIGSLRAHGIFYIVAFQVENRAKRVDHRWTDNIAYVLDETGARHDNNPEAQKELNRIKTFNDGPAHVTPAGATEVTILVFDLPKTAREPYLQVRGSTLMGDVLDGSQFTKTKVKLF